VRVCRSGDLFTALTAGLSPDAKPWPVLLRISVVTSASPGGRTAKPAGVGADAVPPGPAGLDEQLALVARGDTAAFDAVYEQIAASVFGIVRRVIRDPAQSEEVTQDVLLDIWRDASKFDPARGSATAWVMMLAHRRAVDRVRSVQKEAERERRVATADIPYDEVAEAVESKFERERVRRCLGSLTELQRESVTLAYYGGYTYGQVAGLLGVPTGTIKTRMRDALIRLRDCLGVT
jgi:RNA polymerase sigma-70 factor (ECF subfamily)